MKYVVVSSVEWTYPDIFNYESGSTKAVLHTARNSYATGQIRLDEIPENAEVTITAGDGLNSFDIDWYESVPVFVQYNPLIIEAIAIPNYPNRWGPFYIYDCIKPLSKNVTPMNGSIGLYFSIRIPEDADPGIVKGSFDITIGDEHICIPVEMAVYKATVPKEENLKIIVGYSSEKTAKYHKVAVESKEHLELDTKYLKMLRHSRQNMLYARNAPKVSKNEAGKFEFDFSGMIDYIERAMSLGFKHFMAPSIGYRESWFKSTILLGSHPDKTGAMTYEGYMFLSQYLPKLRNLVLEKGWEDVLYLGVADEPNTANSTEFRALCGLIKKFAPEVKLIDACSNVPIYGALDIWVPLNIEYDDNKEVYESYRENGDEVWHYVCCKPRRVGYINRFMDYPLLATRYLFWGNYKYNLGGYLHWAANNYQPDQDPFTNNCPRHKNSDMTCTLPPGDTHIIYPGEGQPWMSMRLEAQRDSAEEYELFRLLSQKNKTLADEICSKGFKSFKDVEYNIQTFTNIRIELLEALSRI